MRTGNEQGTSQGDSKDLDQVEKSEPDQVDVEEFIVEATLKFFKK